MFDILGSYSAELLAFMSLVLLVAGAVRGFAGFGAGMIFMPVATSLMYPPTAAASFLFLDFVIGMPMVIRAVRICDWHTVIPAVIASAIFVHVGTWFLTNTDVLILRWIIFAIVAGVLILLLSGWRYHGRPSVPLSFGIGSVSGILGGISQVSGPPVVAFWLSSAKEPAIVRANLIVFFTLASIGTIVAYALNRLFTIEVFHFLIPAIPVYAVGLYLGTRGFGKADPKYYRVTAYVLIAIAAITSMPLLDGLFR
jgi:uncharacterized membrane protein YfcA